ncbi:hypothetical protein BaRGS_00015948 [Batillaria attramentaria]|uniref:Uncharacterized protein n=1 Tax=Batillaria attramentaria TaxID=370345 RepID=A0ABD0L0B6_9CAEN
MGLFLLLLASGIVLAASLFHTREGDHSPVLTDRMDTLERVLVLQQRRLELLEAERREWQAEKVRFEKMELEFEETKRQWKAEVKRDLEMEIREDLKQELVEFVRAEVQEGWKKEKELWESEKLQMEGEKQKLTQTVTNLKEKVKTLQNAPIKTSAGDHVTVQNDPVDEEEPGPDNHDVITRSDDTSGWEPVVGQLSQHVTEMDAEIRALKNVNTQQNQAIQESGTSVYVRWGRSGCPSSASLVYSGIVGGSYYEHAGAASNTLCLSMSPVVDGHPVPSYRAYLYGGEYQTEDSHQQDDPPCAVCLSSGTNTVMIPGTNQCPSGWTLEYSGHLMAGEYYKPAASEYICVDRNEEDRPSGGANQNGRLLYLTVTVCGSLPCPPYTNGTVVTCAVCSK